jgi:hypothetical protein
MPFTIQIDSAAGTIFSTFSGEIGEQEFLAAVNQLRRDPGFNPTFSHLIDFTEASVFRVSASFMREFAERKPIFDENAIQVVVVPRDHIFGLARMAQILREIRFPGMKIHVVRSREEAYAILGAQRPAVD